jgi:hypothetical protein
MGDGAPVIIGGDGLDSDYPPIDHVNKRFFGLLTIGLITFWCIDGCQADFPVPHIDAIAISNKGDLTGLASGHGTLGGGLRSVAQRRGKPDHKGTG